MSDQYEPLDRIRSQSDSGVRRSVRSWVAFPVSALVLGLLTWLGGQLWFDTRDNTRRITVLETQFEEVREVLREMRGDVKELLRERK